MEANWDELHQISVPPPSLVDLPTPASTLAFDTQLELLWVGNEYGRITAFQGPTLRRYTSYRGHPSNEGPVKQLLFNDKGVLSVAPKSVHFSLRRGLAQWHLAGPKMTDLRCMSFMGKDRSQIVVAGCQNVMLKVDIDKGQVIEEFPTDREYTMMKLSKYICAATSDGFINLLDPDDLSIVKTLTTNNIGICDMDARNNYLVVCGWVTQPQGTPRMANLANVYDLRTMVQLPPVSFHAGAAYVQMHPKMSTTCIIASQTGHLQNIDLMNANTVGLKQANVSSYMVGLVLSPSGEAMVIADADGYLHVWGSPVSNLQFGEYVGQMPEYGDNLEQAQFLNVDTDLPLATVGMPYYRDRLLSAWADDQIYEVGNPPRKIDSAILDNLRPSSIGQWAPNPRKVRRNQAERSRRMESNGSAIVAPKFLSEKARASERDKNADKQINDLQEALRQSSISVDEKSDVPVIYWNVKIRYGKFGIDDFDFHYFNNTQYSGLETDITNSYLNALLQLLKYTPIIRNLALFHAATACASDICLLCELGFFFDMIEKAEGHNCQATNLLKTFASIPQARGLGLLEEYPSGASLSDMIQGSCRFLISQASENYKLTGPPNPGFEQAMSIDALTSIRCLSCHNENLRPGSTYVTDMVYPAVQHAHRARNHLPSFSQVLKASIELETQTRAYCDKCKRYMLLATRKAVRHMPDIMMINTAVKSMEAKQYWSIPGWLPEAIGIIVENGQFSCFEGEDLQHYLSKGLVPLKLFDLVGVVAEIGGGELQKPHSVSLINVAVSDSQLAEEKGWHLFNDFLVREVESADALNFSQSWKSPVMLTYQARSARHHIDDSWKEHLDTSLLYSDWSMNGRSSNCTMLDPQTEAPGDGTLIAIDGEFVALENAEIDVKADGTREMVRPARLALARVSVLRGTSETVSPFIDDYIVVRDDIVDYHTEFSGIQPGDLDLRYSRHHLVPLKIAYKKLWLLLNLGCIFIGHGLRKDFRTINMQVPKVQVQDTALLFSPGSNRRLISLRFLAWYLLKSNVQQGNHDSVEDADTALQLWRRYEELLNEGDAERMVEEVHREGKKWGYKPPGEAAAMARRGDGTAGAGAGGEGALLLHSLGVPGTFDGRDTPELMRGQSGVGTPMKAVSGKPGADYFDSLKK